MANRMAIKKKIIYGLAILLSFLATVKIILWGYGMDEEYHILMSYRNLNGDILLKTMWEPHQFSSYACTALMALYRLFVPTYEGVLIYLRVCGSLMHLAISVLLYFVLSKTLKCSNSFWISIFYYNMVPKQIILPEFSLLQSWMFLLIFIFLILYFFQARKDVYLILATVAAVLECLSYPTMVLHLFAMVFMLFILLPDRRWKAIRTVFISCMACAAAMGLYLFIRDKGSFFAFEILRKMMEADETHELGFVSARYLPVLRSLCQYLIITAAGYGFSFLLCKLCVGSKRKLSWILVCAADGMIVLLSILQIVAWIFINKGYEFSQFHIFGVLIGGIIYWATGDKNLKRNLMFCGLVGSILSLVAICLLTNLLPGASLAHIGVVLVFSLYLREPFEKDAGNWRNGLFIAMLFLTALIGKGYTLRQARSFNNILQSESHLIYGPAKGAITNREQAQMYNRTYETWASLDLMGGVNCSW